MNDPVWLPYLQGIESLFTAAALLAGGIWAWYRFGLSRERETAITIDTVCASTPYEGNHLVTFSVSLENKGSVRVGARRVCRPAYAYTDALEDVPFAGTLSIRRARAGVRAGQELRSWPTPERRNPRQDDLEFDLLADYGVDGVTDFWMEPGETYGLATAVVLQSGAYEATVTFIGDRGPEEFWRRVLFVSVPVAN
jgi:hypothetical protein